MSTILYLSNRLVQAVETHGKGSYVVCQEMAPEGSIINGIITDEEVFAEWIKNFFDQYKLPKKECTLVINSTQLGSRVLELPRTGNAETRRMIAGEFADSRTGDALFTYHVLGGSATGKMQQILAVMAEKSFINAYVHLFFQAGIELCAILPALSNFVIRFMEDPEIRKKNCIVQILDEQEIVSILFVKGIYQYSQRDRVFGVEDQEILAAKAGEVVERLLQFAFSQHIEDPIETLYLCGQKQDVLQKIMEENVHFTQGIVPQTYEDPQNKIRHKNHSGERVEFVYPIGGMQKNEKQLDFLRQLRTYDRNDGKRLARVRIALPAVAALLLCLGITAFLGIRYSRGNQELKHLQRAMQNTGANEDRTIYELSDASIKNMEQKMAEAEELWDHLKSYPTFNSQVLEVLHTCGENKVRMEIMSFSRDSGVLSLNASASDVRQINGFIERLQEQELFETVEYSGYTREAGDDSYSIHVVCVMAAGA